MAAQESIGELLMSEFWVHLVGNALEVRKMEYQWVCMFDATAKIKTYYGIDMARLHFGTSSIIATHPFAGTE